MFRPIRRAQAGGDYTDNISISTNINAQRLQSDTYSNFLKNYMSTNPVFYSTLSEIPSNESDNIIHFPSNVIKATDDYNSKLSSLSSLSVSAQIAYDDAFKSNISSIIAKSAASTNYQTELKKYEKFSIM